MHGTGIFSEHVFQLFGISIKDSSLSERRQRIGFEPFAWLMKHALKPMADEQIDKSCFYKGWRLCGIDASSWRVTNTPQILRKMTKAASRRFEAAFAKIEMCVLVELGLHNPLAAEVGLKREGEWTLSARLLDSLPDSSLLLIDRLYGCGKYLAEIIRVCSRRNSQVLVRARFAESYARNHSAGSGGPIDGMLHHGLATANCFTKWRTQSPADKLYQNP